MDKKLTKKDLEALLSEKEEDILRLRADFENYKKHFEREREAIIRMANEGLILDILSVVDNFERALPGIKDPEALEGFEMIQRQLLKVLSDRGLSRIEAEGKAFDPFYHEVLLQEESGEPDGLVLEELQAGYMLKDKVIRHSKVKIAKNSGEN